MQEGSSTTISAVLPLAVPGVFCLLKPHPGAIAVRIALDGADNFRWFRSARHRRNATGFCANRQFIHNPNTIDRTRANFDTPESEHTSIHNNNASYTYITLYTGYTTRTRAESQSHRIVRKVSKWFEIIIIVFRLSITILLPVNHIHTNTQYTFLSKPS